MGHAAWVICMSYNMRHVLMVSLNVNQFKPTVYFIEDLEDVTHITEESFYSICHFDSSLVYSSPIRNGTLENLKRMIMSGKWLQRIKKYLMQAMGL